MNVYAFRSQCSQHDLRCISRKSHGHSPVVKPRITHSPRKLRAKKPFMFLSRLFCSAAALAIAFSLMPASSREADASPQLPQPPAFTIQDLGPLPFIAEDDIQPGLSDNGKVCFWQDRRQAAQGAIWSQGQTRILTSAAGYSSSITDAVNVRGEVAGWASTSANIVDSRSITLACIWRDNVSTLLGTLGGRNSQAFGINSQSSVVGAAQCADGARHAFLAENALTQKPTLRDLGTLPGGTFSQAYAINSAGHIVGVSNSALPYKHAVCWQRRQDLRSGPSARRQNQQRSGDQRPTTRLPAMPTLPTERTRSCMPRAKCRI